MKKLEKVFELIFRREVFFFLGALIIIYFDLLTVRRIETFFIVLSFWLFMLCIRNFFLNYLFDISDIERQDLSIYKNSLGVWVWATRIDLRSKLIKFLKLKNYFVIYYWYIRIMPYIYWVIGKINSKLGRYLGTQKAVQRLIIILVIRPIKFIIYMYYRIWEKAMINTPKQLIINRALGLVISVLITSRIIEVIIYMLELRGSSILWILVNIYILVIVITSIIWRILDDIVHAISEDSYIGQKIKAIEYQNSRKFFSNITIAWLAKTRESCIIVEIIISRISWKMNRMKKKNNMTYKEYYGDTDFYTYIVMAWEPVTPVNYLEPDDYYAKWWIYKDIDEQMWSLNIEKNDIIITNKPQPRIYRHLNFTMDFFPWYIKALVCKKIYKENAQLIPLELEEIEESREEIEKFIEEIEEFIKEVIYILWDIEKCFGAENHFLCVYQGENGLFTGNNCQEIMPFGFKFIKEFKLNEKNKVIDYIEDMGVYIELLKKFGGSYGFSLIAHAPTALLSVVNEWGEAAPFTECYASQEVVKAWKEEIEGVINQLRRDWEGRCKKGQGGKNLKINTTYKTKKNKE